MCQLLQDGLRQLSQTYCFIARNSSEEDKESAVAEVAAAVAAAGTAKVAEVAEASCHLLLQAQTNL
jgi:hypothetical protein